MKKEKYNYFDNFEISSNYSLKCAEFLHSFLQNFDKSHIKEDIINIHKLEHEADMNHHNMINFLHKDFLPPIEREDIISLAQRIDDVTDLAEEILINIDIFNISTLKPDILIFSKLLVDCCSNVNNLILDFKNFKKSPTLLQKIIDLNKLEEDGDAIYSKYMRLLYKSSSNPIEIFTWTQIYNCFENCFDACESVADSIEAIILKNS